LRRAGRGDLNTVRKEEEGEEIKGLLRVRESLLRFIEGYYCLWKWSRVSMHWLIT
jgi:hypothetical protein